MQAALEDVVDDAIDEEECEDCLEDFPCWPCVRFGDEPIPRRKQIELHGTTSWSP